MPQERRSHRGHRLPHRWRRARGDPPRVRAPGRIGALPANRGPPRRLAGHDASASASRRGSRLSAPRTTRRRSSSAPIGPSTGQSTSARGRRSRTRATGRSRGRAGPSGAGNVRGRDASGSVRCAGLGETSGPGCPPANVRRRLRRPRRAWPEACARPARLGNRSRAASAVRARSAENARAPPAPRNVAAAALRRPLCGRLRRPYVRALTPRRRAKRGPRRRCRSPPAPRAAVPRPPARTHRAAPARSARPRASGTS